MTMDMHASGHSEDEAATEFVAAPTRFVAEAPPDGACFRPRRLFFFLPVRSASAFSSSSSSRERVCASSSFLMRRRQRSLRSSTVSGQGSSLRLNWHVSSTEKSNSSLSSRLVANVTHSASRVTNTLCRS